MGEDLARGADHGQDGLVPNSVDRVRPSLHVAVFGSPERRWWATPQGYSMQLYVSSPNHWGPKGPGVQNPVMYLLMEKFDIRVQMSLSISSAEMSFILYLAPPLTAPLTPCHGPFRLWSIGPTCAHTTGSI